MKLLTSAEADKNKDVFAGMWRPPLAEVWEKFREMHEVYSKCRCWEPHYANYTPEAVKRRWDIGEFDEPMYRRIIEDKL